MSDDAGVDKGLETEGDEQRFVTLGRISAAHGIKGWVKVQSDTSPQENVLNYSPWYLQRGAQRERWKVKEGRPQGKGLVAKLAGCNDRNAAESLVGALITIPRAELPETTQPGEFYWDDLLGLRVETLDGVDLGVIDRLFETGSNDVIVVKGERERLLPYIWQQVVCEVDLANGLMRVDWDPEF